MRVLSKLFDCDLSVRGKDKRTIIISKVFFKRDIGLRFYYNFLQAKDSS